MELFNFWLFWKLYTFWGSGGLLTNGNSNNSASRITYPGLMARWMSVSEASKHPAWQRVAIRCMG